ncbi:MAG TPA: heat-inducible transcriptional repressor HrcA [Thermomicrobiales bacterium]|nr:heat-inducible transcriptional repressor HrcA [Thermomicrobiales bacterium]
MEHERMLSERQREILRLIVHDYVVGGRAVGSHALIERYPLDISSATVRNEMVSLERMGYIQHLHTSAGRVPTDQGYRFYVENFASDSALPAADQIMIRHQFLQVETQLENWLQLAASVLSGFARNVSLVTSPRSSVSRLRHFELLSLHERAILLILVTQESTVRQAMLHLAEHATQAELSACADRLNALLANMTAEDARSRVMVLDGLDRLIGDQLVGALESTQLTERTELHYHGIEHALQQPEFSATDTAQQLFDLLRGGALLAELLPQLSDEGDIQIFIGDENSSEGLRPFGVVVATYGVDSDVTGLLGILGPRRMPYERSISSVRYMATLMSDLMRDLYSTGPDQRT